MGTSKNRFVFFFIVSAIFLYSFGLSADAPKFKNENLTFKPLTEAEQTKLLPQKLGSPPVLDTKEQQKLDKGKVIVRELANHKESKTLEAYGTIDAPKHKVMQFLKDYKGRVGIFPHLTEVTVTWEGNIAHVSQTLKIAFSTISYKLSYRHYNDSFVEWEYVEGDIKNTTGYYKLFPIENGQKTLLIYHVISDSGISVPEFIENMLTKSSMPKVIKAVRQGVKQLQ